MKSVIQVISILVCLIASAGADWPQWRFDAKRSGASPQPLSNSLQLHWRSRLPASEPAWPTTQADLQFDVVPNMVAQGRNLVVTSNRNDCVSSFDTRSGELRWRFFADGPVRFCAAIDGTNVYFVSDDGFLYCLDLESGQLRWKVYGGPSRQLVLGNERMVGAWPARGAPVVDEGKVYFAASLWPFMGVYVHCVDGGSGDKIWTNSGDGTNLTIQPHGAPSFATVAPQGHLVVSGDRLLVPGGRSVPAVFEKSTGKLLHFAYEGKRGGFSVMATGSQYFVDGGTYQLENGRRVESIAPEFGLPTERAICFAEKDGIRIVSEDATVVTKTTKDFRGKTKTKHVVNRKLYRQLTASTNIGRPLVMTGEQIWTAKGQSVIAFEAANESQLRQQQRLPLTGKALNAIAADQRLFVMTQAGELLCYGSGPPEGGRPLEWFDGQKDERDQRTAKLPQELEPALVSLVDQIAGAVGGASALPDDNPEGLRRGFEGYALVLGADDPFLSRLVQQTRLRLIVIEPNERNANTVRRRLQGRGWYGKRVSIIVGTADRLGLPPYFASVVTSAEADLGRFFADQDQRPELLECLRPYGGELHVRHDAMGREITDVVTREKQWEETGPTRIVRSGKLPGAGSWTHQYGDASQAGISRDERVRAPLGILWFGGPSHEGILPRHGHGPSPQVAHGRIVIEGPDLLRCLDVYTGRLLWERRLESLGKYYDNTRHFPGAGEIGSNYVTLADTIYVNYGDKLLVLDATDGVLRQQLEVNKYVPNGGYWGHIAVSGDFLIATGAPLDVTKIKQGGDRAALKQSFQPTRYASGSRHLVVIDRHTGEKLWQIDARHNFRHNAIVAGNGRLFLIDRLSQVKQRQLARRGIEVGDDATLGCYELSSGRLVWKQETNVFGTFLSYASDQDVLLQGGSVYRDRAYDESTKGLMAIRGRNGEQLWSQPDLIYSGPCLIWKDRVITNGKGGFALELLTGQRTGWQYAREYGCNTAIGCQNLLTFRSGAAGFYDLQNDAGTGNLGGFRSSCTNNLIPADGVLAAPDYTRTCTCAYQNQTSLALVHRPDLDYWTFDSPTPSGAYGINLGAPGDRRSEQGTLWLEFPRVGGSGPQADVVLEPSDAARFRFHSSLIRRGTPSWVHSTGLVGLKRLRIRCASDDRQRLTLYFGVPAASDAGQQNLKLGRMTVRVQGEVVWEELNPAEVAGGTHAGFSKVHWADPIDQHITIELEAIEGSTVLSGVEIVNASELAADESN